MTTKSKHLFIGVVYIFGVNFTAGNTITCRNCLKLLFDDSFLRFDNVCLSLSGYVLMKLITHGFMWLSISWWCAQRFAAVTAVIQNENAPMLLVHYNLNRCLSAVRLLSIVIFDGMEKKGLSDWNMISPIKWKYDENFNFECVHLHIFLSESNWCEVS